MGVAGRNGEREGAPGVAVRVEGVVKRYPLFGRRRDRALALVGRVRRLAFKTALDQVSFSVAEGEALGIIGENGSGKSTLLRLIGGITQADEGHVEVARPVAAILELGLGFHPDFTGRENALLYGALIGVPEDVMRDQLAAVLAFAELGEFVDQPVRTYSSGMSARLAFAVATHVDPRVLVVDEALAVGDGAFQKKCVDRMVRFKQEGRTVLFCSHAMYLVAEFCERSIWLRDGRVAAEGPTREVIHAYEDHLRHRGKRPVGTGGGAPPAPGSLASLRELRIDPVSGRMAPGDPITVSVVVERKKPNLPLHVAFTLEDENGLVLAAFATKWDGRPALAGAGDEEVVLHIGSCPFTRSRVDVTAFLTDATGLQILDTLLAREAVVLTPRRWEPGLVRVAHRWEVAEWPKG